MSGELQVLSTAGVQGSRGMGEEHTGKVGAEQAPQSAEEFGFYHEATGSTDRFYLLCSVLVCVCVCVCVRVCVCVFPAEEDVCCCSASKIFRHYSLHRSSAAPWSLASKYCQLAFHL